MRIDAHHHLWQYNEQEFAWIEDASAALRRDYLSSEFAQALQSAGIDASIVVQARQSVDETHWLLACAAKSPRIAGVVGWAPLTAKALPSFLDSLSGNPYLVGFREIVQDLPPGSLLVPAFNEGIRELTRRHLTYDLLVRAGQLSEATRFVDLHPQQAFVLDHAGKPAIIRGALEPWRSELQQLAQRPHVLCKLSGMVTEANWQQWKENDLHPYLDTCLEAFGPQRCMAGSDWPVCLLATDYPRWWQVLERWSEQLSKSEQEQIFGATAASFYRRRAVNSSCASEGMA